MLPLIKPLIVPVPVTFIIKFAELPLHTDVGPVNVATGLTFIDTVAAAERTGAQTPFETIARYIVAWLILLKVNVVEVLAIGDHKAPPFTELSHPVTEPLWPFNVRVPEFVPEHTLIFDETIPPAGAETTVNTA